MEQDKEPNVPARRALQLAAQAVRNAAASARQSMVSGREAGVGEEFLLNALSNAQDLESAADWIDTLVSRMRASHWRCDVCGKLWHLDSSALPGSACDVGVCRG